MRVIGSIQILRGVAALGVAISHFQFVLERETGAVGLLPSLSLGGAGVDLFFVISGFVMVVSSGPLFQASNGSLVFFLRRAARICPLYWAVTTLYLTIAFAMPLLGKDYSLPFVLGSYFFIPVAGPEGVVQPIVGQGWTLNYEMVFYVIFAIGIAAPRAMAVAIVSLILFTLVLAGQALPTLPTAVAFWTDPIIIEFVFGMLVGLAYASGRFAGLRASWLGLAGLVLLVLLRDVPVRAVSWGLPSMLIVAGAAFAAREPSGSLGGALMRLGDASYALYLLHVLPIVAAVQLIRRSHVTVTAGVAWSGLVITVVASVVAALAVHYWFEKPVVGWSKRLLTARRLSATP